MKIVKWNPIPFPVLQQSRALDFKVNKTHYIATLFSINHVFFYMNSTVHTELQIVQTQKHDYIFRIFFIQFCNLCILFLQNVSQVGKVRHHIVTHLNCYSLTRAVWRSQIGFGELYMLIFLINDFFKRSTELPVWKAKAEVLYAYIFHISQQREVFSFKWKATVERQENQFR